MAITQLTKAKKVHFQKSHIKTTVTTFFNSKEIIHKEFMPEGRIVNSEFHSEVLKCLLMRTKHVRPNLEHSTWQVLHDNMLSHTAINVEIFIAKNGIAMLTPPPNILLTAPADFFLVPKWKLRCC
jgi:hypothetical protein